MIHLPAGGCSQHTFKYIKTVVFFSYSLNEVQARRENERRKMMKRKLNTENCVYIYANIITKQVANTLSLSVVIGYLVAKCACFSELVTLHAAAAAGCCFSKDHGVIINNLASGNFFVYCINQVIVHKCPERHFKGMCIWSWKGVCRIDIGQWLNEMHSVFYKNLVYMLVFMYAPIT